jgi:hypothetical protein
MICTKKDLAKEWLEFGGGKSRLKLDEAKMSVDERQLFKDENRFAHMNHAVKHTVTPQRLAKLVTTHDAEWEAYTAEMERPEGV